MKTKAILFLILLLTASGCATSGPTTWPPTLDRELLVGTWVLVGSGEGGINVYDMLHLGKDGTWLRANISGTLTADASISHVFEGQPWSVRQMRRVHGITHPTSIDFSEDSLGRSAGIARPIVRVTPSELCFGLLEESGLIIENRYKRCPAEVAPALLTRAKAMGRKPS